MNLESALEKIYSMHQFNIKLGLDNINKLMKYLDNPEKKLKAIHIAGSNGKGSTASFIASILQEAGYKVGLYTSPHLIKFNERIRINGKMIHDSYIETFITKMDKYIVSEKPTFFEITTAMAFKYFVDEKVEIAVVETGLGGRLDATNVLDSIATVITTISKEHTNILGTSIEEIAAEKVGIAKKNKNMFVGLLQKKAMDVIIEKNKILNNKVYELEKYVLINEKYIKFVNDDFIMDVKNIPLRGYHQIVNAALSILTVKTTFPNISKHIIKKGIQSVVYNTGIHGRYEIVHENPHLIFDGGHNTECISSFTKEFSKEYSNYSKRTLIFGAMNDKNIEVMLNKLAPLFDNIYVVSINAERAYSSKELLQKAESNNIKVKVLKNPIEFIKQFISKKCNECLVVLGSIYLLGAIKTDMEIILDNKGN